MKDLMAGKHRETKTLLEKQALLPSKIAWSLFSLTTKKAVCLDTPKLWSSNALGSTCPMLDQHPNNIDLEIIL